MQRLLNKKLPTKLRQPRKLLDDAQDAQQAEVDKLQEVQDQLMRELASAKKVRITLEQQRQLALLEEAQAKRAAQTPGQKKIWPDSGFKGRSTISYDGSSTFTAVAYAKKQVLAGKPYVWGAEGPILLIVLDFVYAAYKAVWF